MGTDHLGAEAWELEADDVLALRRKISSGGQTLKDFCGRAILSGIKTGLTEAFVIDNGVRAELIARDPRSAEIIVPFRQGTHLRPWYVEDSNEFLIQIESSGNREWPWTASGDESAFAEQYPAVFEHLTAHRDKAVARQDQGRYWWELRACAYWTAFSEPKIVWPDISKEPRFSMDTQGATLGNTAYFIPGTDYYLLGVLASWTTWFFISKTTQPLRLRGDRWQYRLFAQFLEKLPIPNAAESERDAIARVAHRCSELGRERYDAQIRVQSRLIKTFGEDQHGESLGVLNQKAAMWWEQPLNALGMALKASFRLTSNPFTNPRLADEWEPYLLEHRQNVDRLSRALVDEEAEMNNRVYRLFSLTRDEVSLLEREVEH